MSDPFSESDPPMQRVVWLGCILLFPVASAAQQPPPRSFTHGDTLRGANTPQRAWWDVIFYDLSVRVQPADSTISGWNGISYVVRQPGRELQIDLQTPLEVDSMIQDGRRVAYRRDGFAFFATLTQRQRVGERRTITVYYHGHPVAAKRPPWDGGLIWQHDSLGNTWVATANEGTGASVWWPNKDYLADEPDSQRIAITVPDSMVDVSNGRLRKVSPHADRTTTYEWFVASPINNYNVTINAGAYAHFSSMYAGEAGPLTLDFWPLAYHLDVAERQFLQVPPMLKCFESWFGPYPWYEDGYKLVETPHLGMEHQTAIAYGNHYQNGYLGRDLSHTGLGLLWDFIVVHESAHEWWGNSISVQDHADMWLHESFANYSENLYTECVAGTGAGAQYVIGTRQNIRNDRPIVPPFGVNAQGSGDMYYKGGNMLHTIRQVIGDDAKWKSILRGLNQDFRHQTVTGLQVEAYISQHAGIDLSRIFVQYLTTTQIPVFEYAIADSTLTYRWTNVVPGFDMPVLVTLADTGFVAIHPTEQWQHTVLHMSDPTRFRVDENFYVLARRAGGV